jgi:hypothetical protein
MPSLTEAGMERSAMTSISQKKNDPRVGSRNDKKFDEKISP